MLRGMRTRIATWVDAAPEVRLGDNTLRAVVLVAGMTTMATEMSAARLLAPFFGTSVMVWANIIGLILIYLSVGYWYGGRLADRHPHARGLCLIALVASAAIAVVPFASGPVLDLSVGGIASVSAGAVVGSFIGSVLLFVVPITLLGMVPPYAVRLALRDVSHSGSVAGNLYALSTIGSIIGTFGSVLLLIPWIGTRRTMLVFALALALLALWGVRPRSKAAMIVAGAIVIGLAIPGGTVKASENGKVIHEDESHYQFIQVVEDDRGRRLLQLNEGWAVHSIYDPQSELTGGIWDHFLVLPSMQIAPAGTADEARSQKMLIVGNAAGSAARIYQRYRPNVQIDGVEIDPAVTEVGYRYFKMPRENLKVHAADGRPYLREAHGKRWDVIHIDAYRQPYIPFYLTTREFFELVRSRLEPGGVLAINVGSVPGDNRIQEAIAATMRDVFPSVYRYQAEEYNEVIVATVDQTSTQQMAGAIRGSGLASNDQTADLFSEFAAGIEAVEPNGTDILTDDHAPVEWMTDRMIVNYAAQG